MARRLHKKVRSRGTLIRNRHNTLVAVYYMNQSAADWRNWGYRTMSQAKAEELEREGKAEVVIRSVEQDVRNDKGEVTGSEKVVMNIGWRMKEIMRGEQPSPTTLTMSASLAVSGEFFHGGRLGNGSNRPTRGERALITKFRVWPLVYDGRNVPIGPRQSADERRHAEALLGLHGADAGIKAERQLIARKAG